MARRLSRTARLVFAAFAVTLFAVAAFLAHEVRGPASTASTARQTAHATRVVVPPGVAPAPAPDRGGVAPGAPELPPSTVPTLATMPEAPPVHPDHVEPPRLPPEVAQRLQQRQ